MNDAVMELIGERRDLLDEERVIVRQWHTTGDDAALEALAVVEGKIDAITRRLGFGDIADLFLVASKSFPTTIARDKHVTRKVADKEATTAQQVLFKVA